MKEELFKYWQASNYVDYENAMVRERAAMIKFYSETEFDIIRNTYYFVRDKVKHSWDVQDKRVTISASDVLREGVGICWAKANLFAALLRANGIPSGFSHQRLTLGDTPDTGYCIHGLNTVYLSYFDKWIRLDARGNTEKIHAEFSTEEEKLAFRVIPEYDEYDYHDNLAEPNKKLMEVLENSTDALYMYQHALPDTLD